MAACTLLNGQAGRGYRPTVIGINYLDMLQLWLMPHLQEDNEDYIFQQKGALLHFSLRPCSPQS
jgi:hypothetical protein